MKHDIILIVGNGLDLHLNLFSKFKDFFTKQVLDNRKSYNGNNILYQLFYYRYFADGAYDYGSFRRVDENDPTWMDVEGFLRDIATDKNIRDLLCSAYRQSLSNFKTFSSHSSSLVNILANSISSRKPSKSGADSVIHNLLLEDLLIFEESFKCFIKEQVNKYTNYEVDKSFLIQKIIESVDGEEGNGHLRIFNFNYTPFNAVHYVVSNVHGQIDDRVVIGYDSTVNEVKEEIFELSKDWQKIGLVDLGFDVREILPDDIVFYGHSLGEQDYPYFFEIFDNCKLLNNNTFTKLHFCYSLFGSKKEQQDFYNKYQIAVARLLNSYERYSRGDSKRNTIITKLKSQKRMLFLKIPD